MLKVILRSKLKIRIAKFLLCLMIFEFIMPLRTFALTSGPSQPEMQSFEPVGTTNLVDPFSGDFNYNIPLLDVEGYPVNIAYHSGINMDQEASWVGLGWNINPGNITHNVRGVPDDFKGDKIEKELEINAEVAKKFSANIGGEVFGLKIPINLSFGMNFSNYAGVSSSINAGFSLQKSFGCISAGVNVGLGVSTDNGADFDYSVSLSKSSKAARAVTGLEGGHFGQQFNSRQGLMQSTFGAQVSVPTLLGSVLQKAAEVSGYGISNFSHTPISQSNFVPVITNPAFMTSMFCQLKVGGELFGGYVHGGVNIGVDKTEFLKDGTKNAFGYFYLQDANNDDIVDFSRDRDGRFNRKMQYLPPTNMAYDIFNVSGQGTAGNFRGFRTDVGSVYDPYVTSENQSYSARIEAGVGTLFEIGADFSDATTHSSSGPWQGYSQYKKYYDKSMNSRYEPFYLKQAGELTLSQLNNNADYKDAINDKNLLKTNANIPNQNAPYNDFAKLTTGLNIAASADVRNPRANLVYFHTAAEASNTNVSLMPEILSYNTPGSLSNIATHKRVDGYRKGHQVSEVIQLLPDGRRYVYGIPAMNIEQTEYVVSVDATALYGNKIGGIISDPTPNEASTTSADLGQKLRMKTKTPSHAHSYLLTSVLSDDYVDLTGNGITDDDLGEFTKFNYTLKDKNYKWRTPYSKNTGRLDIGVRSDCHDDKSSVVTGTKEIWMLHSIESRNFVALFYATPRADGMGSDDANLLGASNINVSYKLDKIVLYNKKDREQNGADAFPIKTIQFSYDYTLCKYVPNKNVNANTDIGKLTLKAISVKNGTSDIGLLSPYRFDYGNTNYENPANSQIINPHYNEMAKDVWGEYKSGTTGNDGLLDMSNHEFPYVNQTDPDKNDLNAYAWNLTRITVPSGGTIEVKYESDDYASVQDKQAMEMFKVEGVGYSTEFTQSNYLYQSKTNPALYIFFKRKANELGADMEKTYLNGRTTMMFNFEVKIDGSGNTMPSCGIPLVDNVKGYADIEAIGISSNSLYGYVKIKPKFADKMGGLLASHPLAPDNAMILNPIAVSAIHYAQYYNNKALNPASEILNPSAPAIMEALLNSLKEYANYVRNPMIAHLNKNLAKEFNIGRSYVRLLSQGFKKGGGHRVKQITSTDSWNQMVNGQNIAIYGSTYEYKTKDEAGNEISSGVASYEPLLGGDENPLRNRVHTDIVGKKKVFPMTEPIELIVEEPLGEAFFPSGSVGYSKVTIKSIHKDAGKSAQLIQQQEFYTAKDFPLNVQNSDLFKLEDKYPKKINFQRIKKDILRVAQSYVITLNDMHGKQKASRTFIDKDGEPQEVSHTYYNYFTSYDDNSKKMGLANENIPCAVFTGNATPVVQNKELGVEVDFSFDTREKKEKTRTWGLNINTNTLLFGIIPIPIPMPIPEIPKGQDKVFSSVVATKIIQKYGILKSIETYDKGSTVVLENELYDPYTGQVLLTKVNTEHNDSEYNLKTPAYWAYDAMGSAYENIHYEEDISSYSDPNNPADPDFMKAKIVNDSCFIFTNNPDRFNVGDELTFSIKNSCQTVQNGEPEEYKLWIVDKNTQTPVLPKAFTCECANPANPNYPIYFTHQVNCHVPHSSTFVDYTNLSNNGFANDCKYFDAANNVFTDKICNLPFSKLITYNSFHNTNPSNNSGFYMGFNLDHILGIGNLSPLKQYLDDPQNSNRYPLEYMKCEWIYNADYPDYYQSQIPNPQNPQPIPPMFTPTDLDITPNCNPPDLATLSRVSPHEYETPHGKANPYTYEGKIVENANNTLFSGVYGAKPKLYSTSHILNVAVDVYLDVTLHIKDASNVIVKSIHIQNPAPPPSHSTNENNYFHKKFSFVFPYDYSNAGSPSLASIQSLNNPNLTNFSFTFPQGHIYDLRHYINNNPAAMPGYPCLPAGYSYDFTCQYKFTSSAEVKPRASQEYKTNAKQVLVAVPLKRGAISSTGSHKPWPKFDKINEATIKVIRSGKRNRLSENVQEMTALGNPVLGNQVNTQYSKVLSIGATEYSDLTHMPAELNDPATIYFNEFVTGARGSYKPYKIWQYHGDRDYTASLDKNKGTVKPLPAQQYIPSYWSFVNVVSNVYNKMMQNVSPSKWFSKTTVNKYDWLGKDLEVTDASGAIHSNLFGYNNRMPIAVVSNSKTDNAIFDNFEDYNMDYYNPISIYFPYGNMPFVGAYFQNPIKKYFLAPPYPNANSGKYTLQTDHHTGKHSIQTTAAFNIDIDFSQQDMPEAFAKPTWHPFYLRPHKYIFSYWQKVNSNSTPPANGSINIQINNTTYQAKPKTPIIDGWVLYEGIVNASTFVGQSVTICRLQFASGYSIDDIRIMPGVSNMKAYVYHPVNKRLLAVLDENNLATIFDYTAEGKLARIKKETEKGIITLKESRESLRSIITPQAAVEFVDVNNWFEPLINNPTAPGGIINVNNYYPGLFMNQFYQNAAQ